MRLAYLTIACLISGCLFGGSTSGAGSNNPNNDGEDISIDDTGGSTDAANDNSTDSSSANNSSDTSSRPRDMGGDATGMEDVSDPIPREQSNVCDGSQSANTSASVKRRLRVYSDGTYFTGADVSSNGARLAGSQWDIWSDGTMHWTRAVGYSGFLATPEELETGTPTAIALSGHQQEPIWVVTRRQSEECAYAESSAKAAQINCGDEGGTLWGAEVTNTVGTPRYFWIADDGSISSMPHDDTSSEGAQILVPWCVSDDQVTCTSLDFGAADARANDGPYVLLSDTSGRAYLWDTTQTVPDPSAAEDCATPPDAPVPLLLEGQPVMFQDADVVHLDGSNILVHQTDAVVRLHELDENLQPKAWSEELPNIGRQEIFDAATDGQRIAALAAAGSSVRLFAFEDGSTQNFSVVDALTVQDAGVAIRGDQVGFIVATEAATYSAAAVMW